MSIKKPVRPIHGRDRNNYERVLDRTHDILNGGVNSGGNPKGAFTAGIHALKGNIDNIHVSVQAPGVANTEFAVTHNLNRIPTGYKVVGRSNAGNAYDGASPWTTTQIFLKCDTANTQFTLEIY